MGGAPPLGQAGRCAFGESEMKRLVHRTCTICEATCGIRVELEGRTIIRVSGDPLDPFSRGRVCPKVVAMRGLQEDPDRVRRPLVRKGGALVAVAWDEALDRAAEGLLKAKQAGGANAVALYRGNPGIHDAGTLLSTNVLTAALGTRQSFSASPLDTWPRFVQCTEMYGSPVRIPVPDVDRTAYWLIVGANPVVSQGSILTAPGIADRLRGIRARGGKVVVIDPRRSETAELADEHHFVTPGTDAALLLAMAHVLFAEERVRLGAAHAHVAGLEELRACTRAFSPERVAEPCGIPAETIRRLARELAAAPSAVVYGRMGTSVQAFGTLACWAIDVLTILTGNLDRPGGALWARPAASLHFAFEAGGGPVKLGRWRSRASGHEERFGDLPMPALAEEIETPGEGRVRALVTVAGNPLNTAPNPARLERALASLDFVVALDCYVNETTRFAHVVLPPSGPLERNHYDVLLMHVAARNAAKWSPAALEPGPEARSGWETALELSRRLLGLTGVAPAAFDALVLRQLVAPALAASRFAGSLGVEELVEAVGKEPGVERVIDALLRIGPYGDGCGRVPGGLSLARVKAAEHGLDLGPLEPQLPGAVITASGRVELAPERMRADLPRLEAFLARGAEAPLRLVNRRDGRSMNSWLHNLPALAKGRERCTLQIHPRDAARRRIEDGARVRLVGAVGALEAPAEVTDAVMPGVVSLPHGFGHRGEGAALRVAQERPGANVNAVTDDLALDEASGAGALFGQPVEVEPVAADG
jgi:anaerobic selenocysteine-containing dehydrogenase